MSSESAILDDDPDIVAVVLQHVIAAAPAFSLELAAKIDQEVRQKYGGLRVRIPKRAKFMTPEQRKKAYEDAVSNLPTPVVLKRHKISLATMKRLVKQGPGGRS